jgi:hypothetical protein
MPLHWHGNGTLWLLGAGALSSTKNLNGSNNSCAPKPFNRCVRPVLQMQPLRKTHHPPTPLQALLYRGHPLRRNWALCLSCLLRL